MNTYNETMITVLKTALEVVQNSKKSDRKANYTACNLYSEIDMNDALTDFEKKVLLNLEMSIYDAMIVSDTQ